MNNDPIELMWRVHDARMETLEMQQEILSESVRTLTFCFICTLVAQLISLMVICATG